MSSLALHSYRGVEFILAEPRPVNDWESNELLVDVLVEMFLDDFGTDFDDECD